MDLQGLTFSTIMAGIIFGIAGYYLFRRGKKESNMAHLLIGLTLMIYPYFITKAVWVWLLGVVLLWLAYFYRNNDA